MCQAGFTKCPCKIYAKNGLCDYPYKNGMNYEQIRNVTKTMLKVEQKQAVPA